MFFFVQRIRNQKEDNYKKMKDDKNLSTRDQWKEDTKKKNYKRNKQKS